MIFKQLNFWSSIVLLLVITLLKIIEHLFDIKIDSDYYMALLGVLIASIGNYIVAIKQTKNQR